MTYHSHGLLSVGNTSFIVRQIVRNQRDAVVCDASIVYVTVSPDGKPIPVPINGERSLLRGRKTRRLLQRADDRLSRRSTRNT